MQNPNASSEAIYEAVESCIERAQELEKLMATEAAKASDPTVTSSDGGRAARTASEDARLAAARHRKLEQILRDSLERVLDRELRDRWSKNHQRVGAVIERTDVRFDRLPGLIEEMASILADCKHANSLAAELALHAPSGEARRFTPYRDRDRELFARTVLYLNGAQIYPPRQTLDVTMIAPPQGFDLRYSSRWHESQTRERLEREAKQAEELEAAKVAKAQFYGQRP